MFFVQFYFNGTLCNLSEVPIESKVIAIAQKILFELSQNTSLLILILKLFPISGKQPLLLLEQLPVHISYDSVHFRDNANAN